MGGFYRSDPASTNVVGLFFECWNLFLALGYTTFRMVKIVCLSIFHAGRIDSPVLAKRASPVPFIGFLIDDTAPNFFIQDCLLHEAHRHPYIELLGKCYLYKLRYGEQFMNRAGACWRLLFTLSLMPWLDSDRFEDCYESFNQQIHANRPHVEEQPFEQIGEDIVLDAEIGDQGVNQQILAPQLHIDEHPSEEMAEEDIDLDAEIGDQGFDQMINASPDNVPFVDVSGMLKRAESEEEMTVFLQHTFDLNDDYSI